MINILITSGGGIWIIKLAKLLNKDYNIFLTDIKKIKKNKFVKGIFKIKSTENKNFISNLVSICNKNNITCVLPSSDEESISLAKHKKIFEKKSRTKLLISNYSIIRNFYSKDKIYQILSKNKINSFKWKLVKNNKQLKNVLENFKKNNFVIKPAASRGGRDTYIFKKNIKKIYFKNNYREKYLPLKNKIIYDLLKNTKFKFPLIVMDCLYGPIYDIDILGYEGKLLQFSQRERIGAQGVRGNIIKKFDKKYFEISKLTTKVLKLSWLFDFDVMHDQNG